MTVRMGIRELRQNLSAAVRRAERGETIEVTRDGEPVARLTPVTYPTKLDQLIAEGRVRPARGSLDEYLRQHPPRPSTTGISASEALQEDRGE
jgi:prevent-host-death family protein